MSEKGYRIEMIQESNKRNIKLPSYYKTNKKGVKSHVKIPEIKDIKYKE